VPLDPAYEAGLAGHVPVKTTSLDFRKNPKTKFKDMKKMGKDEAPEEIEALREGIEYYDYLYYVKKTSDGRATSRVSGATDYVVAGENPGNKLDEAKKQNLNIIDEKEFKKLIGE
jgi:NAD-dependent DNA ligase